MFEVFRIKIMNKMITILINNFKWYAIHILCKVYSILQSNGSADVNVMFKIRRHDNYKRIII